MTVTWKNTVKHTIKRGIHPYLNGAWAPMFDEVNATDMEVIGEIPKDIDGVYIRNTENPVHKPIGHYHPFDGDGMVHGVYFSDGAASYRNRYVQTAALTQPSKRPARLCGLDLLTMKNYQQGLVGEHRNILRTQVLQT